MKKYLLTIAFIAGIVAMGFSDEITAAEAGEARGSGRTIYTFFFNYVSEPFRFPLFGFVNVADGNHFLPQFGFVNINLGNFSSLQAGFVNFIRGNLSGVQTGFVNIVTGADVNGAQFGFVNLSTGETDGSQIGFVNIVDADINGVQFGFVNAISGQLSGVQLGFINIVDSLEGSSVPIGFISIVRNGGYRAIEFMFSEFHPLAMGIKLGVERFYTTLSVAYNPFGDGGLRYLASGFGLGGIIPIGRSFHFNPELSFFSPVNGIHRNQHWLGFTPLFGFNINRHFSIVAGPSITWQTIWGNNDNELQSPAFYIVRHDINDRNAIVVGARAGLRLRF